MSKIRIVSIVVILLSVAMSANNYYRKVHGFDALVEICSDPSTAYDANIQACSSALERFDLSDAGTSFLLLERGHAFRTAGNYEAAISDLDMVIKLTPSNADALVLRANTNDVVGKFDLAQADYANAIELEPRRISHLKWRAASLSAKGLYDAALKDYERVLQLDPADTGATERTIKILIKLERYEAAIEILKKEVKPEIGKRKRGAYFYLGRLYLHLGYSKQETLAAFEAWKATGEDKPLPALFLGATYLKFEDKESGQRYINEVAENMVRELTEDPFGPWAALKTALVRVVYRDAAQRYFAGVAYSMIRQYDLAKQEFAGFLEIGGPNARLLLVNAMADDGFVPNAEAAKADQQVFDHGLERYMIHVGRKFSLEALGSRK
ncbi:tetratricopeptide repeat protein [Aliiroseovarius sp. S1339]|uniref:tetratricopeptide repeat protein n=1 Tax=Aliiroseovarius sp. S1339 TaxID=2936990 RepID=UPI0020C13F82|nr:tetratricopeptide repeat protein [Aliiroseovarius sp. S1339]MCK8464922.1 tetratricopeptide repeat protein [Aliiroseovarius sp. S1339]